MKFLIIIFTYIITVSADLSHLGYNYDRPQQTFEYHQQDPVLITPPPFPQNIYAPGIRQPSFPLPPIQLPNFNSPNPSQAPPPSFTNYLLPSRLPYVPPAPPTYTNFAVTPAPEQEIQSIREQEPIQPFYRQSSISVTETPQSVDISESIQPIYRQSDNGIAQFPQQFPSFNLAEEAQRLFHEQTVSITEPPRSIQQFNVHRECEEIPQQVPIPEQTYGPAPGFRKETQAIPFPKPSAPTFVIPNNPSSSTFISQNSENDYLPPPRPIQTGSTPNPIFFSAEPVPFSIPSSTPAQAQISVTSPIPEFQHFSATPRPIFQSNVVPLQSQPIITPRPQIPNYNYGAPNIQYSKKK